MASRANNPSLCQDCQIWNNIESFKDFWPQRGRWITLDGLAANAPCMICAIAKSSVESRLSEIGVSSKSAVKVATPLPNYVVLRDTPLYGSSWVSQISISNATKTEVCLLLLVEFWLKSEEELKPPCSRRPENMCVQPQIRLVYSRSGSSTRLTRAHQWMYRLSGAIQVFNQSSISLSRQGKVIVKKDHIPLWTGPSKSTGSNLLTRLLNPGGTASFHLSTVQPWQTCLFDVALLKQWLIGCANLHGNECKKNLTINLDDLPPGFRLINLKSMSIEQPKSNKGFVALSYMWPSETDSERAQLQKHNVELWEKPGGLRNISMPPLISDAMSLCQRLGETYIWIDRFCIVQDDAASKHDQVSGMHQIFRSASFTLVVALDDRNPPGLPGFIHRPRGSTINKPRVKYDVETLVVKRGLELVNDSTWNTRGWTFQERLLSPRRIYITEHEVQYECYVGYASEIFTHNAPYKTSRRSLSHPLTKRPVSQLPGFCASKVANFHITEKTSIHDYMRLVRDYTRRNLSYSSDILNAFAGVEGRLKDVWGSPFHFGLPEKYLHIALMWQPNDTSTLRMSDMSIPSWSWASITNGINYDWLLGGKRATRVVSLVSFYYQSHENGLQKLDVQEWWVMKDALSEDTRFRKRVSLVQSNTNRLWEECPENPWQALERQQLNPDACQIAANLPGCLVFNTTVTRLDVDQLLLGNIYSVPDGFRWIIRNSNDRILDMIVLSDTFRSYYERRGLWRTSPDDEGRTASKDFGLWQLRVMLVERDVSQPYVARRLAVGHVNTRCWEGYATRWETIVLC